MVQWRYLPEDHLRRNDLQQSQATVAVVVMVTALFKFPDSGTGGENQPPPLLLPILDA